MREFESAMRPSEAGTPSDLGNSYEYQFIPPISDPKIATELADIINRYVRINEGGVAAAAKVAVDKDGTAVAGGADYVLHVPKRLTRTQAERLFRELNATGRVHIRLGTESYAPDAG